MEFKGVVNPKVYLIDYGVHPDDTAYPLSGSRGAYICSFLGSYGLLGDSRFANWTVQTSEVVTEDILRCNPKVIIGFGDELLKILTGTIRSIKDVSGNVFTIVINGNKYFYLAMNDLQFILDSIKDPSVSLRFSKDLYNAFKIINGTYKDVLAEKEILNAHSYKEFVDIYESKIKDSEDISYDIETNARPPMTEDSKIIGFSIANKKTGVYVSQESLDFKMPEEDENQIWNYLINEIFEKKNKLIIHNTMYERPYTLCCKGYEIKYDKADDTLVMARLLKGPKESAGLKYQAQRYLEYPDWETDLSRYIQGYVNAVERIGLGPKKFEYLWNSLVSKLEDSSFSGIFDIDKLPEFCALKDDDKEDILKIVDDLKSPCISLYSEIEFIKLGQLITKSIYETVISGGVQDATIPYNKIPDRILSKYGAVDSLATYDLKDYFFGVMDKESTDKVDLHKGYENWLEHMYVAYIMERNGLYWNEELVKKDEAFLTKQATDSLKSMLLSPEFEPFIVKECESRYRPIIFSDYLPEIPTCAGYEVKYDRDTGKYTIEYNGKRVAKDKINEISVAGFEKEYTQVVVDLFKEEVNSSNDFEDLKEIYNPASSTSSHIPRQILITEDLQMGGRINNLYTLYTSPEFEDVKDKISFIDGKFLKIAELLCDPDKLKELYKEDWAMHRKLIYQQFCDLYKSNRKDVDFPEIKNILNEKTPVKIESFDDEGIIQAYNALIVTGMDQDDKSTWTPKFEWMVDYRLYKKSQKLITSYINGTVGRKSVYIVNKEDLESGEDCVKRKYEYFSKTPSADENAAYLLAAKWSPNTAETGRWRSAQHTVPWGSQIKKYYTSRFYGGTLVCPDYSQMEVRTLAAVSHDKNMLDLFRRGDDFHTETAKQIFRKDEVTQAERRFSKTATFSLLYGSAVESFAKNYCKGDMDYANMIYGGFFRAYPEVQKWVQERHEEVKKDHRVSLELSNRFISIEPDGTGPGAVGTMMRKAQNYPIQSQSADLTGCVIWDIQKYIEDNNLHCKVIMYVHDSIEIDIPPYEMIRFVDKLKFILNDSPMRRMGLPSRADVALGCSLGHEIEMESIEHNEECTECTMELKGYKDEIEETVNEWKKVYKVVEVSDESWKDIYVSIGELFILKKAFAPTIGTTRQKGTCKVHIKYY